MTTDRFGNTLDPRAGYAWGAVLASPDDEVRRMHAGRAIIRARVDAGGDDAVFNMTGLIRAFPLRPEDLLGLQSQLGFYARFSHEAEDLALKHMGGDPGQHDVILCNRVSSAMIAIMMALDVRGRTVLSVVPGGRSHPSIARAVELCGGAFSEVAGLADLRTALAASPGLALLVITPLTPQKFHLPEEEVRQAARLARAAGVPVFLDDAHMASRMAFFDEPPALALADAELAVWSLDEHVDGPRAAAVAGERALVERIGARALEYGLEAQSGHYVAALRALEGFDLGQVRGVAQMVRPLFERMGAVFGDRAYLAGPGVAVSGEDLLELAMARAGISSTTVVPNEAASAASFVMLREHGLVTIPTIGRPGSAATFRLMVYPDGPRLGLDGYEEAVDDGMRALVAAVREPARIRALIFDGAPAGA